MLPEPGWWPTMRGSASLAARTCPLIPAEAAGLLFPDLDQLTEDVIEAVQATVPEYARPLDDASLDRIRRARPPTLAEQPQPLLPDPQALGPLPPPHPPAPPQPPH